MTKYHKGGKPSTKPKVQKFAEGGAVMSDMVARGRGLEDQDRDNSAKMAARWPDQPKSLDRKDVIDFLRKPKQ